MAEQETIDIANVPDNETPLDVPNDEIADDSQAFVSGAGAEVDVIDQSIADTEAEITSADKAQDTKEARIDELVGIEAGRGQAQIDAEKEAGVAAEREKFRNLQAVFARAKEEFDQLELDQEGQGRGITLATITGRQGLIRRSKAIKLGLNLAEQQLQLGRIQDAQATADRLVELEFAPIEFELKATQDFLDRNADRLTREDTKRAARLQRQVDERTRLLEDDKLEKQRIANVCLVSTNKSECMESETFKEALSTAEGLDEARNLDIRRKEAELIGKQRDNEKKRKENILIGEKTDKEKKAISDAMKQAETAVVILDTKIGLVKSIIEHKSLDRVVGPPIPYFPDFFTRKEKQTAGSKKVLASVAQLVDKETIDTLVDLKDRGGTLGALSENEARMLRDAATKIGFWQVTDKDGKVIGYEVSEKDFITELNEIKRLANIALTNARGGVIADDEDDELDELLGQSEAITNPGGFFPSSTPSRI